MFLVFLHYFTIMFTQTCMYMYLDLDPVYVCTFILHHNDVMVKFYLQCMQWCTEQLSSWRWVFLWPSFWIWCRHSSQSLPPISAQRHHGREGCHWQPQPQQAKGVCQGYWRVPRTDTHLWDRWVNDSLVCYSCFMLSGGHFFDTPYSQKTWQFSGNYNPPIFDTCTCIL